MVTAAAGGAGGMLPARAADLILQE